MRLLRVLVGAATFCAMVSAAVAEEISLSCSYPKDDGAAAAPESGRLTPRALVIDTEKSTAVWNDILAPATVSEVAIRFSFSGFEYSINRLNGEIVFSNPGKLQKWAKYRADMMRAAGASGKSEEIARSTSAVDSAQSKDFAGVQHVGMCDLAAKRKF